MPKWTPIWALPNVSVPEPIGVGPIALVDARDARVRELASAQPNFRLYLNRFSSTFQRRISPSLIIVDDEVMPRELRTVDSVASFRDLVALSVIPYQRARAVKYSRSVHLCFSDTFWCHPWMVSNDYEHMISQTMAQLGLGDVSECRAQSLPTLSQESLGMGDIDSPLFDALMTRWRRRYLSRHPRWQERALFRSLNMANQAALLPAASEVTFYDVGRSLALWVSAFEILTHSGKGRVELFDVYKLLAGVRYHARALNEAKYRCHPLHNRSLPKRIFPCWLYGELVRARNDFLHGNPIKRTRLRIPGTEMSLYQLASPLYRMALTSFLKLNPPAPKKRASKKALGRLVAQRLEFRSPQDTIEDALLKGLRPRKRKPAS
jgi:hypothetical protein